MPALKPMPTRLTPIRPYKTYKLMSEVPKPDQPPSPPDNPSKLAYFHPDDDNKLFPALPLHFGRNAEADEFLNPIKGSKVCSLEVSLEPTEMQAFLSQGLKGLNTFSSVLCLASLLPTAFKSA